MHMGMTFCSGLTFDLGYLTLTLCVAGSDCFYIGTLNAPNYVTLSPDWCTVMPRIVILHDMLASDWLIGFQPLSLQLLIILLPYWNCELA